MTDPVLKWNKASALDVVEYVVVWKINGNTGVNNVVVRSDNADAFGYTVRFSFHNPEIELFDGDSVEATVFARDNVGLNSVPVNVSLTVPNSPPDEPKDVTLTLA